jgi:hypothetical protein
MGISRPGFSNRAVLAQPRLRAPYELQTHPLLDSAAGAANRPSPGHRSMKSLIPAGVVGLMLAAASASFAENGTITVIDPKTNASVATILALDPTTHRLFVSCLNNILTVVDSDSGKVITKLPIGPLTVITRPVLIPSPC